MYTYQVNLEWILDNAICFGRPRRRLPNFGSSLCSKSMHNLVILSAHVISPICVPGSMRSWERIGGGALSCMPTVVRQRVQNFVKCYWKMGPAIWSPAILTQRRLACWGSAPDPPYDVCRESVQVLNAELHIAWCLERNARYTLIWVSIHTPNAHSIVVGGQGSDPRTPSPIAIRDVRFRHPVSASDDIMLPSWKWMLKTDFKNGVPFACPNTPEKHWRLGADCPSTSVHPIAYWEIAFGVCQPPHTPGVRGAEYLHLCPVVPEHSPQHTPADYWATIYNNNNNNNRLLTDQTELKLIEGTLYHIQWNPVLDLLGGWGI